MSVSWCRSVHVDVRAAAAGPLLAVQAASAKWYWHTRIHQYAYPPKLPQRPPGKAVCLHTRASAALQVCKAGLANARKIWLTRHGESEFNSQGRIGGDSCLSMAGEEYAKQLPAALFGRIHVSSAGSVPVHMPVPPAF